MKFLKENSYNIVKMLLNQLGIGILALVMTMATHQNDQLYFLTSIFCIIFYLYLLYTMTYELGEKDKPAIDAGRKPFDKLKGLKISLAANAINIICGVMIAIFSLFIVMQQPVEIINANAEPVKACVKLQTSVSPEEYTYTEVKLYSNQGGTVRTDEYENSKYCEVIDSNGKVTILYDEQGNELSFFSDYAMRLSTSQKGVENWASNLYGVPYIIATFFQAMYAGVRSYLFANSEFVYLFTPIPALFFCFLAYFNGARGKRMFPFLPALKPKKRR